MFVPDNVRVPEPALVKLPAPEITPEISLKLLVELISNVPICETSPLMSVSPEPEFIVKL